jgi:hypothetical protein
MAMSSAELADERRRGRLAGVAAIAAGLLFPVGLVWAQVVNTDLPDNDKPAQLRFVDRHSGALTASSAIRALALLLLIVVSVHLYRATKMRNPEATSMILVLGIVGPAMLAVGGLAHDIGLAIDAADFSDRAVQTKKAAEDITDSPFQLLTLGLSIAGTLGLGLWFVVGSLNAMRVGLLSRFMGVLGIIIGPSFLFPFPPLVMAFWLVAVGALFMGFWPRGAPPAWEKGEAVPWPKAGEGVVTEAEQTGGSRNGEVEAVGSGVRKPAPESETEQPAGAPRRKRKRKR